MYVFIRSGCAWSVALRGLSPAERVAFSLRWPLLWSTARGVRVQWLWRRLRCFAACGIFPDRGSNHISYIGRWILIHGTTREDRLKSLNKQVQCTIGFWLETNKPKKRQKKMRFFETIGVGLPRLFSSKESAYVARDNWGDLNMDWILVSCYYFLRHDNGSVFM